MPADMPPDAPSPSADLDRLEMKLATAVLGEDDFASVQRLIHGARAIEYVYVYDGQHHRHGCIHYVRGGSHGLEFREDGWGLICDMHYEILVAADRAVAS